MVTTEEEHDELLIKAGTAGVELALAWVKYRAAWVRFFAALDSLGRATLRELMEPE